VLINPIDLQDEPLEIHEVITPGAIDYAIDTRQVGPMPVDGKADLLQEHRGPNETVDDIRIRCEYSGHFEVLCARCLEAVAVPLTGNFDLLFRPETADADGAERAITEDETEIGYYARTGLLLEDVVREQVLLSLPGRTLCKEDCKGLCAQCGQNLNLAPCHCIGVSTNLDPRWSALQGVSVKQ
jgi:uncharacterized protein